MSNKLQTDSVLKAAHAASSELPAMIEYLKGQFYSEDVDSHGKPLVSAKEKTGILRLFMSLCQSNESIKDALGVRRIGGSGGKENPLIAILGGKIDIVRGASDEELGKMLLDAFGQKPPEPLPAVLDAETVAGGSSNGRTPDSDSGNAGSSPAPPAAASPEEVGHGV